LTSRQAQHYAEQSIIYALNSGKAFSEKEYHKAGEFLWGSMAQALKAHAYEKEGSRLYGHRNIREYATELSAKWVLMKKMAKPVFYDFFLKAETLHINFYETDQSLAIIEAIILEAKPVINEVLKDAGFYPRV